MGSLSQVENVHSVVFYFSCDFFVCIKFFGGTFIASGDVDIARRTRRHNDERASCCVFISRANFCEFPSICAHETL